MPKSIAGNLQHVRNPDREIADLSRRTSASTYTLNISQDDAFRRADVANSGLSETNSDEEKDEDEVERQFEEHWRNDHRSMTDWTAAMRTHVRDDIHGREST